MWVVGLVSNVVGIVGMKLKFPSLLPAVGWVWYVVVSLGKEAADCW